MAEQGFGEANDPVISFDLDYFFDEKQNEIDVIDESEVTDSDLGQLLDNVQDNFPELMQKEPALNLTAEVPAEVQPAKVQTPKRFPILTEKQVDDTANNTVKAKTRKQTVWGVKVFIGTVKYIF